MRRLAQIGSIEAVYGSSIGLQFPFTNNNGTISANNGTIELYGVIDWNAVSSMSFTNANLKIAGQLDNTGKTLNVQENGSTLQRGAIANITGGTIASPNGAVLTFLGSKIDAYAPEYYAPTRSNVTLAAPG